MYCVYWTYIEILHPLGVNPFVDEKMNEGNEGHRGVVIKLLLMIPCSRVYCSLLTRCSHVLNSTSSSNNHYQWTLFCGCNCIFCYVIRLCVFLALVLDPIIGMYSHLF